MINGSSPNELLPMHKPLVLGSMVSVDLVL